MSKTSAFKGLKQEDTFSKIENRLTFAFGGLVFVLMLIVYMVNSYMDEKKFEFERNSLANTIASTLALSIEKVSFGGRYQSSLFVEKITKEDPRIVFMFMIDENGAIIAGSNEYAPKLKQESFAEALISRFAPLNGGDSNEDIIELDQHVIVAKKEINSGYKGELQSTLLVGITVEETQFLHSATTLYTTLSIAILTIVSLFIIRWISTYIGFPVKNLAWKFYNILRYSPVMIHIHDREGNIVESSASFEDQFGLGNKRNIYDVIPADQVEKHKKVNDVVFSEGKSLFVSTKYNTLGKNKYFLVNKFPIEKSDRDINLICGFSIDITKQKELEENLKKKSEELALINKSLQSRIEEEVSRSKQRDEIIYEQNKKNALGELLVNIAHQWRQPLNLVGLHLQNISDMIEYNEIDKKKIYEIVDRVMVQLEYLSTIITKFTDFYEDTRHTGRVVLKEALGSALDFMGQSLKNSRINIESVIEPEDIVINGDQNSVSEIFLALLINIKEIVEDRKLQEANVKIKIFDTGSMLAIDIHDDAGGIAPEVLGNIFDPYTTTHFKSRNRGLGLYTVKNSIEYRFGGTIDAKNVGKGALFEIRLKKDSKVDTPIFADDGFEG